jgi:hypothetical protein
VPEERDLDIDSLTLEEIEALPEKVCRRYVEEGGLSLSVLKHWREFRPKMCAGLEKQGLLYRSVLLAAVRTADLLVSLTREGLQADRAQEIAYREWYLLPDEED